MRNILANWIWLLLFCALAFGFIIGGLSASNEGPTQQHAEWTGAAQGGTDAQPADVSESHAKQNQTKAGDKKEPHGSTVFGWISNFFEVKLTDLLIAIFTVVLAIKTSGLFRETAGLRELAAVQSRDMKASIKAAEKAADAAMLGARAAIASQLPIVKTAIGKIGFDVSKVGDAEETFTVWVDRLVFSNLGNSKAFPIELRLGATVGEKLPETPSYILVKPFKPNFILEPDPNLTPFKDVEDFAIPMSAADQGLLVSDQLQLWYYCCFVWDDFMGTRHETGFCWLWTGAAGKGAFRVDATPAYNRKT
jgi:hypothetical protein